MPLCEAGRKQQDGARDSSLGYSLLDKKMCVELKGKDLEESFLCQCVKLIKSNRKVHALPAKGISDWI